MTRTFATVFRTVHHLLFVVSLVLLAFSIRTLAAGRVVQLADLVLHLATVGLSILCGAGGVYLHLKSVAPRPVPA